LTVAIRSTPADQAGHDQVGRDAGRRAGDGAGACDPGAHEIVRQLLGHGSLAWLERRNMLDSVVAPEVRWSNDRVEAYAA
jgi:hypothetical protein